MRGPRWVTTLPVAYLLSFAFGLVANVATNTVEPPASWSWWTWTVWALVGLIIAASVWVQRSESYKPAGALDPQVITDLAFRLRRDWSNEAVRRDVTRPSPLMVSWSSPGDKRHLELREPTGALNKKIVAKFKDLPKRRLVVLGDAGAGKSVFCLLLTLGLLDDRASAEPVPVLLSINVWDPVEPVDVFVARRLTEDYADVLGRYGDPRAVADRLVEQRAVLPVLDGLDELPVLSRIRAVKALNDYAQADNPLVMTCRGREYRLAVEHTETGITAADIVELEPVTIAAMIVFLYDDRESSQVRWKPVFQHLQQQYDQAATSGPLARALSTPLMVTLARTAYQEPGTDPAELLRLTSVPAVTSRLVDEFVGAVYTPAAVRPPVRARAYRADRARRWLTCLAYLLSGKGTRDLHWWQITPALLTARPRRARILAWLVPTATAASAAGLIGAAAGVSGIGSAVATAVIASVTAAGAFRSMWPLGYPAFSPIDWGTRTMYRVASWGIPLVYGLGGGLLTAVITSDWAASLLAGLVVGLVLAVIPSWQPGTSTGRATPATTLGHHRRLVAAAATQHALTCALVFTVAAVLTRTPPLTCVAVAALLFGTTAGLQAGGWTWIRFRIAHVRLATQGWLPWRLRRFLDDAHHRGVLRQAGTVYQFRHAILQDHLAATLHTDQLRARADAGDEHAARRLAAMLDERGHLNELRSRHRAGDRYAGLRLAKAYRRRGRPDLGVRILQTDTYKGDWEAGKLLVELLDQQGDRKESIGILRAFATLGGGRVGVDTAEEAAQMLVDRGRSTEAIRILQARRKAGEVDLPGLLPKLLARQPDKTALREMAKFDSRARDELAKLLADKGRLDDAIAMVRADAAIGLSGAPQSAELLAGWLARRGNIEELQARADAGDTYAGMALAKLLAERGDLDRAVKILRAQGEYDSMTMAFLAFLLADHGRIEEGIQLLQGRADANDSYAQFHLPLLLARHGRTEEASYVLRARVAVGEQEAPDALADYRTGWEDWI